MLKKSFLLFSNFRSNEAHMKAEPRRTSVPSLRRVTEEDTVPLSAGLRVGGMIEEARKARRQGGVEISVCG